MDYKVLYRKYRPKIFDDIVGQEYVVKTLKNAIVNNKSSHAYIFTGPRGTGKTSIAKVFSRAINCENNIDGNPCNKCASCLNADANADIIEIDAASNNGVDEIREIINNIRLTPSYSKYKVYIIDEVHMLSQSAFNALLLTLEEPPPYIIFILATTEIQNIPITVLSRCQRYDFKKFSINELCNHLKNIAKSEKIEITPDALTEISYIADGGMRDALGILDQLIDRDGKNITLSDITNVFGTISNKKIKELINYLEESKIHEIIAYITEISESGINIKVFLEKLTTELKEQAINIKTTKLQTRLNYQQIKKLIFELTECQIMVKTNVNLYSVIELILLDYIEDTSSIEKITSVQSKKTEKVANAETYDETEIPIKPPIELKIKENKTKIAPEPTTEANQDLTKEFTAIRINNCFVSAKKDSLEELKKNWTEFLSKLKIKEKKLLSLVAESNVAAASDTYAIIVVPSESTAELVNEKIEKIEQLFNEIFSLQYLLVAISAEKWLNEKEKYVKNIKNGYKYEILEEIKIVAEEKAISATETLAKDIFGTKLEIK